MTNKDIPSEDIATSPAGWRAPEGIKRSKYETPAQPDHRTNVINQLAREGTPLKTLLQITVEALKNSGYDDEIEDANFHHLADNGNVVVAILFDHDGSMDQGLVYLTFKDGKWFGEY